MTTEIARKFFSRHDNRHIRLLSTTALAAAGLMAFGAPAAADNWTDHTAVTGNISVDTTVPNTTNITQTTDFAKVKGDGDINAGWTVNVAQPGSSSKYVLYDIENDPTVIRGNLNANGEIFIFDQNGVIFTDTSSINVGSIIASTGFISDSDLLDGDGKYTFQGVDGDGSIELNGHINVASAGLAAFVAPTVINNGIINARLGKVAFAAGETVTLDLYGDKLVEIAVDGKLADALLKNTGEINAEGGVVSLTAAAAKEAVDNIINVEGVINASSFEEVGGKIVLNGGDQGAVSVAGTLDASGNTGGGSIEVTGENVVVAPDAEVLADATEEGDGGTVRFWGNRNALLFGNVFARGGTTSGNGGFVELSAAGEVGFYGFVDTTAENGNTGVFLIDPENIDIGDFTVFNFFDWDDPNTTVGSILRDISAGGTFNNVLVDENALAAVLRSTNVNLWATNSINTVGDADHVVDLSVWDRVFGSDKITRKDLTLSAETININHDVILGRGNLYIKDIAAGDGTFEIADVDFLGAIQDIDVDTVNLNGTIFTRHDVGGPLSVAEASRLDGEAHTVNVLSDGAKINQGIQFADDGADVTVASGTYTENIIIDRALKLTGLAGATLQAASAGNLITIASDDVTIDPFVFDGLGSAAYGLYSDGFNNVTSLGNTYQNFTTAGAYVANGDTIAITGDTYTNTGSYGIQANTVTGLEIVDNTVSGSGIAGIDADGTDGALIEDNDVSDFATGISVKNTATKVKVFGNTVENSDTGIYGDNAFNLVIRDNTVTDSAFIGVHVKNSDGTDYDNDVDVIHNTISGLAGSTGVLIENSAFATVGAHNLPGGDSLADGNDISGGAYGVTIKDSENAMVRYNKVHDLSAVGVRVDGSDGALIKDNDIDSTGSHAVMMTNSDDSFVQANDIDFAGLAGIRIETSDNVTINSGNDINGTGKAGIGLHDVTNSLVDGNNVANTDGTGIWGDDIDGTTISNNTVSGTWLNAGNGSGAGVLVKNTAGVTVDANTIDNTNNGGDGVEVSDSSGVVIQNNLIGTTGGTDNISGEGIDVNNSAGSQIKDNTVTETVSNGISINPSPGSTISGNTISNIGGNGIYVLSSSNTLVDDNDIDNVGINGILVESSDDSTVSNNEIDDAVSAGIYALNSDDTQIHHNEINDNGASTYVGYGILVDGGDSVDVDDNKVEETNIAGIAANNTTYVDIDDNLVKDGNGDGIFVASGYGAEIRRNTVNNHDGDGIDVNGNNYVSVWNNDVYNTGDNGVEVSDSYDAQITWNDVDETDGHGIFVERSYSADIENNEINNNVGGSNTLGHGIYAVDSNDVDVKSNWVEDVVNNGIYVSSSDSAEINSNTVQDVGGHGIYVNPSDYVDIAYNTIRRIGQDGINVYKGDYADIWENNIYDISWDGIDVDDNDHVEIWSNDIYNTGYEGIEVSDSYNAQIVWNDIDETDSHAILVERSYSADIENNEINRHYGSANTKGVGIYVLNSDDVDVKKNVVDDTTDDGIRVEGEDNAEIHENAVYDAGGDGIDVNDNDYVRVWNNDVFNVSGTGVEVSDSRHAQITWNDIDETDDHGIFVERSYSADIEYNEINKHYGGADTRDNGIYVINSDYADVKYNAVDDTWDHGIYVSSSDNAEINGNDVDDSGKHGIFVNPSDYVDIIGNTIHDSGWDGIHVDSGIFADIKWNHVHRTGDDGIDVDGNYRVEVEHNTVKNTGQAWWADGDGIAVWDSWGADVKYNDIEYTKGDGAEVLSSDYADIVDNNIYKAGDDGIDVEDSDYVDITDNYIYDTGYNGIEVQNSDYADIINNDVFFAGLNGIYVNPSDDVTIQDNLVEDAANDGVQVNGGMRLLALNNKILRSGDEGMDIRDAVNFKVIGNAVSSSVHDGIEIVRGIIGDIINNTVTGNGTEGIEVRDNSANMDIIGNIVTGNDVGILFKDSIGANIDNNTVTGSITTGIEIEGSEVVGLLNNTISDSGMYGLHTKGGDNGYIVLAGNKFINNPVHARFESGLIDLSSDANPNFFNGGVTALQFDLFDPLDPLSLRIFNNTLGHTQFAGQSGFYVELLNNALYQPGTPTVINGLNASYDGFVPADSPLGPGILTLAQFNALEAKIRHFLDGFDLGLIFFGLVPTVDQEDIFRGVDPFAAIAANVNVTVAGLPTVPGGEAFALNALAPAAGGELSPEDLANLEPAAGSEDTNCWGDALNGAASGQITNYSFGGDTFGENSLAGAAGCGSSY